MKPLHGADEDVNVEELRYLLQNIVEVTAWHGDYGDAICPGGHTDARLYLKGKPYLYCHHECCQVEVAAVNVEILEAFVDFCAGRNIKIELTPEEKREQGFRRYLRCVRADARLKLAPKIIEDVPVAEWMKESPFKLDDWPVGNTWALWLAGLFALDDLLWIGDLQQSGRDFKHCFRTAAEWIEDMDIPPGPQVCAAPFDTNKRELQDHIDFRVIPQDEDTGDYDLRGVRDFYQPTGAKHFVGVYIQNGQYRRLARFLRSRPYLVVESDTLTREQFGSLVRHLQKYTTLRSMTDTAGKGIHAVFDRPDLPSRRLREFYAITEGLGADPRTLNRNCPTTRLPGYTRVDENFNVMGIQKLLYLNPKYRDFMKDDKDNKAPAPDPVADMAALVNLSLKQRKKAWLDRADGYDWSEDSAEASAEQACRDAKALGLSRGSIVAKIKHESITLHCFLFEKLKPFYASDLKAAQAVLAIEDETGLGEGEPVAQIEMPDIRYLHHRQVFAHLTSENRYEHIKESTVLKMAVMAGLSNAQEANGQLSEAERCVLDITKTKGVDWDGALAGYKVGVHCIKGCKLLVSRSFDLIEPDPNAGTDCPHIMALANGLYGDKAIHLHLWRKEAYESLLAGRRNTNMAFIVVGPRDSGKSLDLDFVTVPLLGGRKANAYAFMGNKTPFNDEQIGSEVHVIDDGNPFETAEARKQFANAIKQEVASNEAWCHPKGKAGFTVPLYRRLVILANPEDIALMPELNESMEDKLIMLEAKRFSMPEGCLPLPARNDLGAREAFVARLRKELPAYINYLLTLEPSTKDFESRRWGVAAFKDENLVKQMEELCSTHEKHAVIQKTLFRSRDFRAQNAVEVEINQLFELLCEGEYKDRAAKLFRNVRALGTALGHLNRKQDGYIHRESHGESLWQIKRDTKFDEAASLRPDE